MKTNQLISRVFLFALCLCSGGPSAFAANRTAFGLAREGNQYIGQQSRDEIVEIRSEKSIAVLTPEIWYVVYYDPDAPLKAVEVKFEAGEKVDVSRPLRLLEPITGDDRVLDHSQLKTDSDAALATATAQPILKNLTVKSSQLWLQHGDEGPVWKVKLWAAKLKNPAEDADIGDTYISAADGSIIRGDLHPENVN